MDFSFIGKIIGKIMDKFEIWFNFQRTNSPSIKQEKLQNIKNLNNDYNFNNNTYNFNVKDASLNDASLSDLAKNIEIMIEFLVYKGCKVASLAEERCVKLTMYNEEGKTSYAKRSNQFFLIGKDAIGKCRDLLQSELEPSVRLSVKEILKFLTGKEKGQKDKLGKMEMALLTEMQKYGSECSEYAEKLGDLKKELDKSL